jgi:hypothetical protein
MDSWHVEFAISFTEKQGDFIREQYIKIRRNRLGGMMALELLEEIGLLHQLKGLTPAILSKEHYEFVIQAIEKEINYIMDEVEGIE